MRKYLSFLLVFTMIISMAVMPSYAYVPLDTGLAMYVPVNGSTTGTEWKVSPISTRNESFRAEGVFDATDAIGNKTSDGASKFYSLATHYYTQFTFDSPFFNIEDTTTEADIEFAEVTWGSTWHPEAALVFLTDAETGTYGSSTPYLNDDAGLGLGATYFAGVIWNKVGLDVLTPEVRQGILDGYESDFAIVRDFIPSTGYTIGNDAAVTLMYLPEEVVSASGVILIDITDKVYSLTGVSVRTNSYGTGPNQGVDGYDLDAIRVYGYEPIVVSGLVDGQKYDASGSFLSDMPFDFEIYTWVEGQKGELVAKAQSEVANLGDFLFSQPGEIDNISASNLELPVGDYYIEEVNIPLNYEFVKFVIVDGLLGPGPDQGNGAMFTIVNENTNISIEAYNQKKLSHFVAYKYNGASAEPEGFVDYSFDFVLKDVDNLMDYAYGHSLTDGSGLIVWDLADTEEVEMLEDLELPEGNFEVMEIPKPGFNLTGTMLYIQDVDDLDPTVTPGSEMTVPFMSLAGREIRLEYANSLIYRDETAYAFFDESSVQLNTIKKNKNWGWYIETANLTTGTPYTIYAGAGGNDISKGMNMGTVTFYILDNYYVYYINLTPFPGEAQPMVTEEHFGVYMSSSDIPNAPGKFTNLVPADMAGVLVLHMVVSFPTVLPD